MATPMTASQFVAALKKEGVKVSESYSGWRTHNRNHKGPWGGVNGVVIHHTAGTNSKALCYNGMASLPGPLCHTHLAKDGTATMMSAGRANHAGSFPANAHNAVVNESKTHPRPSGAETVDGNRHYYGIEIENLGNGKDAYPEKQYVAAVKWAAAICRYHGWSEHSVIGHKEGTTRKIDPHGPVTGRGAFSMDTFRRDVAAQLAGKPVTSPSPENPTTPAPKDDDVPGYVSLSRSKAYTLAPGVEDAVEFLDEHSDNLGHHGAGGSQFVRGVATFSGVAHFALSGVDKGAEIQVRVSEVNEKGEYVANGGYGEYQGTGGKTFVAFPFSDHVGAKRGVRVRIKHFSSKPITVESVSLKAQVWER